MIGLYLDPHEKSVVLCCDEKSQCQALERTQHALPLGVGHIRTRTHDYIPGHHASFIDWEEYGRNLETMARKARPDRRQPAKVYYTCKQLTQRYGEKARQSIPAEAGDAAVGRFAVAALNRENIALALAVQEQVRADFAEADAQRALRIERQGYAAELAQRRYYAADPVNRLVAAPLEAAWNERLRESEEAVQERDQRCEARDEEMSAEQVRRIEELARAFAQVWEASVTEHVDRNRLLRLLVEDATLAREGYQVRVELRLRGGKALALDPVALNRPRSLKHPVCPATVAALDAALDTHSAARPSCAPAATSPLASSASSWAGVLGA